MLGRDPARAHVLGGAAHARIRGVEVHLARQIQVAAHHRALKEVNVLERVHGPGDVVQVLGGGVTVFAAKSVHDAHRSACGAEIHLVAPGFHVVLGVLAVQHKVARGIGHGVFNQCARKNQAAGVGEFGASLGHQLDAAFGCVGQADVFQGVKRGVVDFEDIGVAQRLVGAAVHAGAHRAQAVGQRARSRGPTGLACAATGVGFFRGCAHGIPLAVAG